MVLGVHYSSTPARRSNFGVPLHVVKVSYRAPPFVLDLTWSILRPQFYIDADLSGRTQALR